MDLKVGNLPVTGVYVGSTPVPEVYVGSKLVWSATVQITLGAGLEARDQFRAALSARGLTYQTVTEIPFDIEFVGTGSARDMFRACSLLTSVPAMDTSGVTNMRSMFNGCASLTTVPDMDTSSVTEMGWMFQDCSSLTTVPDMDTSQVTDMNSMFRACSLLTSVPAMDTSGVTNMSTMFRDCSALTYVPNMDTAQVTDTGYMFYNCAALADGNVRLIGKHPNVTTTQMIQGSGLTREPFIEVVQIPLGSGWDAQRAFRDALSARGLSYRNVTELPFNIELVGTGAVDNLFDGCQALTSVPAMDTSQVTSMAAMFYNCRVLTSVPRMSTSNVTNMERMFYYCSSLTSVPAMDTSQVTSAYQMFRNCSSLTDDNVRLIVKNPNVITDSMIQGSGLTREPFYATDRLPNPPAPRVVTINKHSTIYGQWDKNSATGDVSLIQGWVGNEDVRFTAYVTCDLAVMSGDSYLTQQPGAVLRSGADISPWSSSTTYTFTEVI